MPIPLPIETSRLHIRAFEPEADSEPMLAVYGDPEVMRYIPGGPMADIGAVGRELATYAEEQRTRGFAFWAVVERASGEVIGDAGYGIFDPTGDVELGYTLARHTWGRGYATEAARACLEAGLANLDVPRVVAVVEAPNAASMVVAERIGMTRLGDIEAYGRPHVLFAATR
jgi:[ribosomal protein S5]-alanine N-acetyltransferase